MTMAAAHFFPDRVKIFHESLFGPIRVHPHPNKLKGGIRNAGYTLSLSLALSLSFHLYPGKNLGEAVPRGGLSAKIQPGSDAAEEGDQGQGDGAHDGKARGERKGFGPVSHRRREHPGAE